MNKEEQKVLLGKANIMQCRGSQGEFVKHMWAYMHPCSLTLAFLIGWCPSGRCHSSGFEYEYATSYLRYLLRIGDKRQICNPTKLPRHHCPTNVKLHGADKTGPWCQTPLVWRNKMPAKKRFWIIFLFNLISILQHGQETSETGAPVYQVGTLSLLLLKMFMRQAEKLLLNLVNKGLPAVQFLFPLLRWKSHQCLLGGSKFWGESVQVSLYRPCLRTISTFACFQAIHSRCSRADLKLLEGCRNTQHWLWCREDFGQENINHTT